VVLILLAAVGVYVLIQVFYNEERIGPTLLAALPIIFGVILVAVLIHGMQRRSVGSIFSGLRGEIRKKAEKCDLTPLTLTGATELDPLIKDMNSLLTTVRQRIDMLSAIESATRQQAAEINRDALTGLFNRHFLDRHLDDEVHRTKALRDELSVIMGDVDHFKHYNDTQGHQMGDKVLQAVSNLIQRNVRSHDHCIRYGGEEFLILLPRTNHDRACRTAERIRLAVSEYPFPAREQQPNGRVTMSLGVASMPAHAKEGRDLVMRADEALYAAKHAGRNRVVSSNDVKGDVLQKHQDV
jgi:diguanylate cyclase (GGDEF)-like protein